jgi:hypothetical protein
MLDRLLVRWSTVGLCSEGKRNICNVMTFETGAMSGLGLIEIYLFMNFLDSR